MFLAKFLAALPRVARLPVGDLARLAAVAARVAATADGEGGLRKAALDAADVARPPTPPYKVTTNWWSLGTPQ